MSRYTEGWATAAALAAVCTPVLAQDAWPERPVRMIVPFQAGSATDSAARVVGLRMGALLKQPVIVENRVGASGLIGAEAVVRAAPDGYTILLGTVSTQSVSVGLNSKMSFDPARDLAPVGLIGASPYVLVSASRIAAKDLAAFVAEARTQPGKLTYASAGNASMANLAAQLLAYQAGIQLAHIPYKSSAQSVTDTINGTIALQFGSVMPVLPYVKNGVLKALAVTGAQRLPLLPDVPTVAESGLPGYRAELWMGLFAPKDTPADVLDRLSRTLNAALADREVAESLLGQGIQATPLDRRAFAGFVQAETAKWSKVVKDAGITGE
ncbi:Bug family tripartite tricarboxylate transporter substrate binding protein [Pigmentiphaga kullae]|uniref:Tripartite-type tricarboxylate transporter receptor subunit TctC n=1 Tax=Pigmentiphaga kullae TaxID=151784 RepID=A0A4Q7NHI3_9BURK|nr:tripartite tricarboxylate transporter substrate binding protein [Pigmentiphaga kullae]RZS84435.1 tripartite-type tricarboxylate transporter receptor subunit TctC [Pigmentiphaga kullae]